MSFQLGIIGSGSWGTALAMAAARNGVTTQLWGPEPKQLQQLAKQRCNQAYLGKIPFPERLEICHDFEQVVASQQLLLAVPSDVFREVIGRLKPVLTTPALAWATKGLDPETDQFPSEMVASILGDDCLMAVLSGPSFAKEVAQDCLTAITCASNQRAFAKIWQGIFRQASLQVELSDDLIGVQLGGAAKNVIAIATGIADSVAHSANTRSAIICRGLQEIQQLGLALGAKTETFYGLSGMGDLVLTCSDDQSRNRRFGLALGRGQTTEQALAAIGQVVEGLQNTEQVLRLAKQHQVSMPITQVVKALLDGKIMPTDACQQMLVSNDRD